MAEFKAIQTQEEFDVAIQHRLERERAKFSDYEALKEKAGRYDELAAKNYEKALADVQDKLDTAQGRVTELTGRAERAEASLLRSKIAHEYQIPYELAERLSGATEDEMRKDAEALSRYIAKPATAPLASTEPPQQDAKSAALRNMLQNLNMKG